MGSTKAAGSLCSALHSGAPGALISMKNHGEGLILPPSRSVVTDILDISSKLGFKSRAVVFFFFLNFFSYLVINRNYSLMEIFNLKWNLI